MANKTFESQFYKNVEVLNRAVNRAVELDFEYPKLYKKLKKFFINEGVEFYNEPEADYELIIDLLSEKLKLDVKVG
jgi:RNA recognition motif-containing protein